MALSDTARIAVIAEATPGVTPATPAFSIVRLDSDSLVWNVDSTQDPELNPDRMLRDVIGTGANIEGSLETPWAANTLFEAMLEGIFADDFVGDDLDPGTTLKTFTIEKRFENEAGGYGYHRYTGVTVSSLTLSQSPDELVTASWGLVGGGFAVDTSEIVGATYGDPSPTHALAPRMTGAELVADFVGGPAGLSPNCFTNIELTIDSQNQATKCLGTRGEKDLHLGKFVVTVSGQVLYKSTAVDDLWLGEGRERFDLVYTDRSLTPNNHTYTFNLDKAKVTNAGTPTPVTGELVQRDITIEAVQPEGGSICTFSRATA